jgi:hypothetical protein
MNLAQDDNKIANASATSKTHANSIELCALKVG